MSRLHLFPSHSAYVVRRVGLLSVVILCFTSVLWGSTDSYSHYVKGLQAERKGDLSTALSEYNSAVQLDPTAMEVYKDLAQLNLRVGKTDAALEAAQKVQQLAPKEPLGLIFVGNVYAARGDLAKAAAAYKEALALDPKNVRALERLGEYYVNTDPPQAISYLQRILEIVPRSAETMFQIGFAYQKAGNLPQAIASYRKAAEWSPDRITPHVALADLYDSQKSTANAIAEYEAAVQIDTHNPVLYERLGRLYFDQQKYDDASSQFQNARALDAKAPEPSYWLGRIAEQQHQWTDAARYLQEAYRMNNNPQFIPLLAYYLSLDGRVREAVTYLEKLRGEDAANPNAQLFLAMGYLDLNQVEKAKSLLDEAVRLHPNDAQLHFQTGVALDRMKRFEPAMNEFRTVLKLEPKNSAAMNYLAYSYADRNTDLPEAVSLANSAVQLDSDNGAYWDTLGWVEYRVGHRQEALNALQKATELTPDPLIFEHWGDVLVENGQLVEALRAYGKASGLAPADKVILQKKIDALSTSVLPQLNAQQVIRTFEGNTRQLNTLKGWVSGDIRLSGHRRNADGKIVYERPGRMTIEMTAPTGVKLAEIQLSSSTLSIVPPQAFVLTSEQVTALTLLPRYFSGDILLPFEGPAVSTAMENNLMRYQAGDSFLWMDVQRGVLAKYREHSGAKNSIDMEVGSYSLVGGLWLPGEITMTQGKFRFHLRLGGWTINDSYPPPSGQAAQP